MTAYITGASTPTRESLAIELRDPRCAWMRNRLLSQEPLKLADVEYFSAWLYGFAAAIEEESREQAEGLRSVATRVWGLV